MTPRNDRMTPIDRPTNWNENDKIQHGKLTELKPRKRIHWGRSSVVKQWFFRTDSTITHNGSALPWLKKKIYGLGEKEFKGMRYSKISHGWETRNSKGTPPQEAVHRWAGKGRWENEKYERGKTVIKGWIERWMLKTNGLKRAEIPRNEKAWARKIWREWQEREKADE